MNFLNLQYFLVVAEELSFTRAAEKLYISQQSLSNHIIKLEKEFGVELFNRSTPLSLTYAGARLAKMTTQILDLEKQISIEMEDISNSKRGKLTIGISHTRGRAFLPSILPIYKERYPGVELSLAEGNTYELEEKTIHGSVDLMIGFAPSMTGELEMVDVLTERIYLIVPDVIFKRQFDDEYESVHKQLEKGIDINLFKNSPFLMMSTRNRLRCIADEYFAKNNIKPNIVLITENIETLLALCIEGMGITFYPEMFVKKMSPLIMSGPEKRIHIFPLNDRSTDGTLMIGYHKKRYLSNSAKKFIDLVKEIYNDA